MWCLSDQDTSALELGSSFFSSVPAGNLKSSFCVTSLVFWWGKKQHLCGHLCSSGGFWVVVTLPVEAGWGKVEVKQQQAQN